MIKALQDALNADFSARKFPVRAELGPTRLDGAGAYVSRIVVERDTAPDRFEGPRGAQRNAPKTGTRFCAAKITIWAQCNRRAALRFEHERECERFVDAVFCAASAWIAEHSRVPDFAPSGRYLRAEDLAGVETWPGVVYELTFQIPRGVFAKDYDGAGLPEGTPTATTGSLNVRRNGADTPEIAS